MSETRRRLRAFLTSFTVTLCVLVLGLGFLEVDARSRQIGFGDEKTLINTILGENWQLPWCAGFAIIILYELYRAGAFVRGPPTYRLPYAPRFIRRRQAACFGRQESVST